MEGRVGEKDQNGAEKGEAKDQRERETKRVRRGRGKRERERES